MSTRSVLLVIGGLALNASVGCAGDSSAHKPCPDAWVGSCTLRDLRKVEERELPMPYVTYEAIYAPQVNAEYPQFTPAEIRMRFGTPARAELSLVDHLKAQALVKCRAPAAPGSCLPQEVIAEVVPFDADRAQPSEALRTTGCAAIDAASEQDRLAKSHIEASEASAISERFAFAADSAQLSPEASELGNAVAQRIIADPSLECVGLVGQTSHGESPSLAEARARAVKRLLVSLGVDGKRLLTIAATASVFSPGAKAQNPEPDTRRVSLSVLLKTAAGNSTP